MSDTRLSDTRLSDIRPYSDTRQRILTAAQALISRDGVEATSVRAIIREAGVNIAAVHYHFGSRDNLLRVVANRMLAPIDKRRAELLDAALVDAGRAPLSAETLVEAYVRPNVEAWYAHGASIGHLIGRAGTDPATRTGLDRFFHEWHRALPAVPEPEFAWRLRLAAGALVAALDRDPPADPHRIDVDQLIQRLVSFLVPAMRSTTLPN